MNIITAHRTWMARVAFSDDIRREGADCRNGDLVGFLQCTHDQCQDKDFESLRTSGVKLDMVVGVKAGRL